MNSEPEARLGLPLSHCAPISPHKGFRVILAHNKIGPCQFRPLAAKMMNPFLLNTAATCDFQQGQPSLSLQTPIDVRTVVE